MIGVKNQPNLVEDILHDLEVPENSQSSRVTPNNKITKKATKC